MRRPIGALLAAGMILASLAFAPGVRAEDDPMREDMQQTDPLQKMGPAMSSMMANMMGGMLDFLVRPETADQMATFMKNYYDSLVKKGFSEEQAMRIVTSGNLPSMK